LLRDKEHSFIASVMREPKVAHSTNSMAALTEDGAALSQPLRGQAALWLAGTAVLMLRVAAILVLLSPLFGAAILLG
jgi:hypothetical protein